MKKTMLALSIAAMFLAGCGMIDRMDGVAQIKDLQKHGVSAKADVLQIWDTGMTLNHDPVVGFLLRVYPDNGASFEAKTKAPISRLDVPRVQPGSHVPVVYDPKDPQRVALDMYRYR